ncbi:hypothetical protein BpHYR1_025862 [Brachionus plicatilis]|uniref:Uncharacterized protein n=1 Tax=Brachionus plicatilis TaxID=10195 RepID=A0A3M7RE38_BRAPC|nr:hypothetical protein BpHYR1_025862 [Brachionus plicatilis]
MRFVIRGMNSKKFDSETDTSVSFSLYLVRTCEQAIFSLLRTENNLKLILFVRKFTEKIKLMSLKAAECLKIN